MASFLLVYWIVSAVTLQSGVQHVHRLFSHSPAEVQRFPFAKPFSDHFITGLGT